MAPIYIDMPSTEAVARARRDRGAHGDEALDALDHHLRWQLLVYLQDREGDLGDLRDALIQAVRWARDEELEPWDIRWAWFLELLSEARSSPSIAADLELLEPGSRPAELLAILAASEEPLRPRDLKEQLGVNTLQQVSNLLRDLEERGLAARSSILGGRAVWVTATTRGLEAASRLRMDRPSRAIEEAEVEDSRQAIAEPVEPWPDLKIA